MAIKIRRNENFSYVGFVGFLDQKMKQRADEIYEKARTEFKKLNKKINLNQVFDSLERWYRVGNKINKLIHDFKISYIEKKYFWLMLYDFRGINVPERAKKFHIQNDFRVANILAKYALKDVKKVGAWTLWREILGSTKIGEDDRVARWVTNYILQHNIKTRDGARPLLKAVRNRLKKIDTTILSDKKLVTKLKEIDVRQS